MCEVWQNVNSSILPPHLPTHSSTSLAFRLLDRKGNGAITREGLGAFYKEICEVRTYHMLGQSL